MKTLCLSYTGSHHIACNYCNITFTPVLDIEIPEVPKLLGECCYVISTITKLSPKYWGNHPQFECEYCA